MITGIVDTNRVQAQRTAHELDETIRQLQWKLTRLESGLKVSRSSGYAARLRGQLRAQEQELAHVNRMRSELRRRFDV